MLNELDANELNELAKLVVISEKAKARESLCRKIGITYYKELGFVYEPSSEDNFAISLIYHLYQTGNMKAICQLCCNELAYIFNEGEHQLFLEEIAGKLNCNQKSGHHYQKPYNVEEPIPVTPTGGAKSQSKKLSLLPLGLAVIGIIPVIGLLTSHPQQTPTPSATPASPQVSPSPQKDVVAGPIWNNDDAKVKCPVAAAAVNREWNGAWTTTVWGKESVCGLK